MKMDEFRVIFGRMGGKEVGEEGREKKRCVLWHTVLIALGGDVCVFWLCLKSYSIAKPEDRTKARKWICQLA